MVNLAGLHEQLDDLQSHWQNVQRNARQSPGKHQHFVHAVRNPGDLWYSNRWGLLSSTANSHHKQQQQTSCLLIMQLMLIL